MTTQADTQAIPRVIKAKVVDSRSGADAACPDDSCDRMYADAMENLAVLHKGWLLALAKLHGAQSETEPEQAAA